MKYYKNIIMVMNPLLGVASTLCPMTIMQNTDLLSGSFEFWLGYLNKCCAMFFRINIVESSLFDVC